MNKKACSIVLLSLLLAGCISAPSLSEVKRFCNSEIKSYLYEDDKQTMEITCQE